MSKNNYTSEITDFLKELDEKIKPDSPSRRAEKAKYDEINEKRDNPDYKDRKSKLWEDF
ncbi:CBU_0585 family protein [Kangiella aquimarina]|uniref:CBU_0585 family protein n=1 Tax=Kangiella aquimarina TaxID=261965 RepID=A0ABZ0X1M5_9GAMM|nr:CBU_0585 family protein [Kangiella aquimarina]WQG84207.1 CBU_0585 family protein [Kangiella aquimarina]